MLRFADGFGYCSFAKVGFKYTAGAGFFGSSGTLTGSIDPGPYASTSGLTWKVAHGGADFVGNTGYVLAVDMGATESTWIAAMWINPNNITSRQTFFALISNEPPNKLPAMVLHLNAALKLELNAQNSGVGSVAYPRINTIAGNLVATSAATIPQNAWTHICIRCQFLNGSLGRVQLWVNDGLDTDVSGINIGPTTAVSQAWLPWQTPLASTSQITISQLIVCDTLGSVNNAQVSPSTRISTIFPNLDVANGNWTPAAAGSNFSEVNSASGPGAAAYVTLPSLTAPDELFGIPAISTGGTNLAVVVNICSILSGVATMQALMKQGATKYLLGSVMTVPNPAAQTLQGIAETNPATSAAWKDSDISADAWGFRGLTGTGENVEQFFLEKVFTLGLGSYSY